MSTRPFCRFANVGIKNKLYEDTHGFTSITQQIRKYSQQRTSEKLQSIKIKIKMEIQREEPSSATQSRVLRKLTHYQNRESSILFLSSFISYWPYLRYRISTRRDL